MKIHIVKKGDTLWNIAKMYGVDFEEIKQMNAHLAEPDMIMPGMKIRIPVHQKEMHKAKKEHKSVKKEKMPTTQKEEKHVKEIQKEPVKQEVPKQTKPIEQIKEDDEKHLKPVKPVVPFEQQKSPSLHMQPMPTMPKMPEYPHISPVQEEKVEKKEKKKETKEMKTKEAPSHVKQHEPKGHSIPLTSYGCHCYCGLCTPMHFGESYVSPMMNQQQHHMHVMPAQPYSYQMMPSMHMQQPVGQSMYDQTYRFAYQPQPYQMQAMPQMPPMQMPFMQEQEMREEQEEQIESLKEPIKEKERQPVSETYPPMYSEQVNMSSYPEPPGFHHEEQTSQEEEE